MFLYEKLDNAPEEFGGRQSLPDYVSSGLNPKFELRPYQKRAFENFITFFESDKCPSPLQVLFHMATGSGKTLIMAGLIIYLYKHGYRNFLFFVNLSNIVEKTKENFLNPSSAKYLFADDIVIDGERIRINQVENFQNSEKDAINICFTTTQGLHMDMRLPKENTMTYDDFDSRKVVLISDESHHLNVETKKKKTHAEEEHCFSWEQTVKRILEKNVANILLEFTATCDLGNSYVLSAYENKIVFDYPLAKFYNDKYSKDIITLRSNLTGMERALQALVLSQYRLKMFQEQHLLVKPVVLLKSKTIEESKAFIADFHETLKNLNAKQLQTLRDASNNSIMAQAFGYFQKKNISFDILAAELRDEFSEDHCISANEEKEFEGARQIILNSLEDKNNQYRAIFEVKKLDEGWDVLNLFDIVRMYETKPNGKRVSASTISEAQLIGRGARYFPFKIKDEQPRFQRKYDEDISCELRHCETLYYHCINDSNYVSELKKALREIGLDIDKMTEYEYMLKKEFKNEDIYKSGLIFLNSREKKDRASIKSIPSKIKNAFYSFQVNSGSSGSDVVMTDNSGTDEAGVELNQTSIAIKEIAEINYALVNKVLMRIPAYKFSNLKDYFPNIASTRMFITDDEYLGSVRISISCREENPTCETLYAAVFKVLNEIAESVFKAKDTFQGKKQFEAKKICDVFHNKKVKCSKLYDGGQGISQNDSSVDEDWRIDLSKEDWYAYTDNYGTSEEKAFVAFFRSYVQDLKKIYSKIYLVRNEREFHIYSFEDGYRFEPDYVLFLQKSKGTGIEQLQIFIEPKGEHLLEKDAWKEEFLLRLKDEADAVKIFRDSNDYKVWGFHFFNKSKKMSDIKADFAILLNS